MHRHQPTFWKFISDSHHCWPSALKEKTCSCKICGRKLKAKRKYIKWALVYAFIEFLLYLIVARGIRVMLSHNWLLGLLVWLLSGGLVWLVLSALFYWLVQFEVVAEDEETPGEDSSKDSTGDGSVPDRF